MADRSLRRAASNDRELSRASTAAFDDAASFFGAGGGTTSDGGYASSGAGGREDGGGSSVTGGRASPDFRRDDGVDFDDDMDDMDDRSSLYSRSLSASSSRRSDITDPLDDFLKRYTISIMPEETVAKLKKRAGPMVFGVNYCPQWDARVTYTAKPAAGAWAPWWLHKLSYSPGSGSGAGRRERAAAASFSDAADDDDLFVEPLEAAGSDDASVSGGGSCVGGGGAGGLPRPRSLRTNCRALASRLPQPQGVATLTSPKLDLFSWLRLQFVADADLASRRFGVRWRVSTKWSASPGRIGRKERWPVFDGAELKPRWSVDLYTPELTGAFGAPQRQLRRGRGGGRRRRGGAAAAAAAGTGGSAHGVEEEAEAAEAGPGGSGGAASASDDDDVGASSAAGSLRSSATSFRGRRRGARGRGRVELDKGHCHLLVPRLDAVVDADAAAASLARAAKFAAVTPLRVLAGIPLAAARRAAATARRRALPTPPPSPPPRPPAPPAFGGLTLPPLPSFLSRPARFSPAGAAATAARKGNAKPPPPSPPPRFGVRGWPWSLGMADGLEAAAGWLRRATEESARAGGGGAASAANA